MKKNEKGMTLIEVILAMAIFSIIFVSFLTMFSASLIWIHNAGNRGEAYSLAQSEVERRILTEDAEDTENLDLIFGEEEVSIRGGRVESTKVVQGTTSSLETFIPYVPTVSLDPMVMLEGQVEQVINVTGKFTHFSDKTKVEILDVSGNPILGLPAINRNVVSSTNLQFELPRNDHSVDLQSNQYVVRVTTTDILTDNIGTEVSRARFIVEQPRYIVAGERNIFISADGINWINRTALKGYSLDFDVNAISTNYEDFLLVGSGGRGYKSERFLGWYNTYIGLGQDILNITWSQMYGKYFAVSENGTIYSSSNGTIWSSILIDEHVLPLYSIEEAILSETVTAITALGDGAIIIQINEGVWTRQEFNNITFEDGSVDDVVFVDSSSSGDRIVAIGYREKDGVKGKSVIATYSSGGNWKIESLNINANINSIVASNTFNRFLVAAEKGKVLEISFDINGNGAIQEKVIASDSDNLIDLYSDGNSVIVISKEGKIFRSVNDGESFTQVAALNLYLNAISGR